jgi:glycosyltransferase involved in cell wall biosynthesis
MMYPGVSIVTPAYNRAAYILDAVRSGLAQTAPLLEIIVVDDGSDDGTPELVESINDPKVRLIRLEHVGAPAARNRGVAEARGEFILWLDSDDVLDPGAIQAYAETLKDFPKAEVLYGKLTITYPDLTPMDTLLSHDWFGRNAELMRELFFINPVPNVGTMVKRECYERVGGYDESYPRAHDYEFWTRLAPKSHFKYVRRQVARYRWHESNLTGGTTLPDRSLELRLVLAHLERAGADRLFPELAQGGPAGRERVITAVAERLAELGAAEAGLELARSLRGEYSGPS